MIQDCEVERVENDKRKPVYGCDFAENGDWGCEVFGHVNDDGIVIIEKVKYYPPKKIEAQTGREG